MKTVGKVFEKKKKLTKKEVIAILEEKGVDFDEKATVDELKALIPAE